MEIFTCSVKRDLKDFGMSLKSNLLIMGMTTMSENTAIASIYYLSVLLHIRGDLPVSSRLRHGVFDSTQQSFEHILVVVPGAIPNQINFFRRRSINYHKTCEVMKALVNVTCSLNV